MMPTLGDPTDLASCRSLTNRMGPGGQRLSAPQGRLTPLPAKPAKPIKWMNGHSPRRIARVDSTPLAVLIQTGSLFSPRRKDLSLLGSAVVPFTDANRRGLPRITRDMAARGPNISHRRDEPKRTHREVVLMQPPSFRLGEKRVLRHELSSPYSCMLAISP